MASKKKKKFGQYIGSHGLQGWVDFSGYSEPIFHKRQKGDLRWATKDKRRKEMSLAVITAQQKIFMKELLKEPEPELVVKGEFSGS
jgi:hypothetical protein